MTRYTRSVVEEREAMLAINLYGGGGFEIWQYTSRVPRRKKRRGLPGDLGIYAVKLRAIDVAAAHRYLLGIPSICCGDLIRQETDASYFFCRDVDDNLFQIVDGAPTLYKSLHPIGGIGGVIIGCHDIDRSLPVYRDLLGYNTVLRQTTQTFDADSFLLQPDASNSAAPPTATRNSHSPAPPIATRKFDRTVRVPCCWRVAKRGGRRSARCMGNRQSNYGR